MLFSKYIYVLVRHWRWPIMFRYEFREFINPTNSCIFTVSVAARNVFRPDFRLIESRVLFFIPRIEEKHALFRENIKSDREKNRQTTRIISIYASRLAHIQAVRYSYRRGAHAHTQECTHARIYQSAESRSAQHTYARNFRMYVFIFILSAWTNEKWLKHYLHFLDIRNSLNTNMSAERKLGIAVHRAQWNLFHIQHKKSH